ncbi:glycine betaine ABC transporter substrate-binding protein [Litorivicinus lipolyticus]|uniref:glycine betaine ABC transporter substrate-binding protein n=1 Tax=Litorivicinus lipolyticus TaxID=418701 RepID=UPI001B882447|nr:glycine betaine ABC transporter substrate-binding protein [Litorivicinus lipolyticus]
MHELCKRFSSLALVSAFAAPVAMAECGDVSVAEMNWASAEVIANIDSFIMTEGYGCNVELIPGATLPSFTSLNEKGRPQVLPEMWANAAALLIDQGVSEGRMEVLNEAPFATAGEGYFIPRWLQEANPELTTVEAVLSRPDLFPHPEDDARGGIHTCPAGWGCEINTGNLFRAFDMESKGWDLVMTGSGAGLDGTIAKAGQRDEPWFGYYWTPTTLIGQYDMVLLDWETGFDGEHWDACIVNAECTDPKPTRWTESRVVSLATTDFSTEHPELATYLKKRVLKDAEIGQILSWKADNQATGEDTAMEFLATSDAWKSWVPADVAAKVEKAL